MGMRQSLGAVAVAAAIAGLGGAAVYAATDSPTMGWGDGPPGHGGPPGQDGPGRSGPPGPLAANDSADLVHGESVHTNPAGAYTTEITQVGVITAMSPTSVTVRSSDGFSQTYTLPKAADPPFTVDDRVLIRGTRAGARATATTIGDPPPQTR
ncbi:MULTISPECIES: hypothetical protein [Mycolicibacterium]|nr:hypothetical protein [Mycolicibacterium mageritense]TXH25464.1 MAG: hypothetical protein E6R06_09490 [Mycobacterium sp.]